MDRPSVALLYELATAIIAAPSNEAVRRILAEHDGPDIPWERLLADIRALAPALH